MYYIRSVFVCEYEIHVANYKRLSYVERQKCRHRVVSDRWVRPH